MSIIELKHLSKSFGGVQAVEDFNLLVDQKDIIGIIGPNGAGKTTIFNLISGVYSADSGQIILEGREITRKEQHEIARLGIARTFQNIRLFKELTVLDNVITAVDPRSGYGLFDALTLNGRMRREEKRVREESQRCLEMVGLSDFSGEKPGNLSYGYQRKLEIARALATNPLVLLLDEPGAGLNPSEVLELTDLIKKLHRELGLTVLLIDHRMELIMELCRRIYVQNFGRTLAVGTPAEIRRDEEVIKAYLGEDE